MNKDFYVVKFGEKYYNGMLIDGGTTRLTLVDDLASARWYKNLDRKTIQRLLDLGGSVLEISIWEHDRTFALKREWEKADEN